jgi:ActD protein
MTAAPHGLRRFVLGEFTRPEDCVEAAHKLRVAGVKNLDAYSPYPLHGIDEALELPPSKVPLIALCGGVSGALGGYAMQWWMNAVNYPINVGNRPQHGFWTNIPITFECGILLAVLSIFFSSIFGFFGLPRPYHPVFESERFRTASLDRFWISAETDTDEHVPQIEERFREVGAHKVHTVVESV